MAILGNQPPQPPSLDEKKRQQKTGTGFTNVQQYLQSSGPGAGQAIAGKLGTTVAEKEAASKKALGEAEAVRAGIQANLQKAGTGGQIAQNISAVAAGQGDVGALEGAKAADVGYFTSGKYATEAEKARQKAMTTGTAASAALGALETTAGSLASERGQSDILSKLYGRSPYGAGQQRLDQLLLQQTAGKQLSDIQKQAAMASAQQRQALGQVGQDIQTGLQSTLATGGQAQQAIQQALSSGLTGMTQAQQTQLEGMTSDQQAMIKQLREGFGQLSKDLSAGKTEVSQEFADLYKKATGQDLILEDAYTMYQDPKAIERLTQAKGLDIGQAVTSDELRRMRALSVLGGGGLQISQAAGDQANPLVGTDASTLQKEAFVNFLKNAQKDITGTGASVWTKWNDVGMDGKKMTERATKTVNVYDALLKQLGITPEPGKTMTPEQVAEMVYGRARPQETIAQGDIQDKGTRNLPGYQEQEGLIADTFREPAQWLQRGFDPTEVGTILNLPIDIAGGAVDFLNTIFTGSTPSERRAEKKAESQRLAQERAAAAARSNVEQFLKTQGVGRKLTIKPTTPTGGQ
jgi:hypothetical protein